MAFLRDVGAYFCACGLLLLLLFNGSFAMSEAALLLLFYAVYIGAAIVTSRCAHTWLAEERQQVLSICLAVSSRHQCEHCEYDGMPGGLCQPHAT